MRTALRALLAVGWIVLPAPDVHSETQSQQLLRERGEVMTGQDVYAPAVRPRAVDEGQLDSNAI